MKVSWSVLGRLGAPWDGLWGVLGVLEPSWDCLGSVWGHLGASGNTWRPPRDAWRPPEDPKTEIRQPRAPRNPEPIPPSDSPPLQRNASGSKYNVQHLPSASRHPPPCPRGTSGVSLVPSRSASSQSDWFLLGDHRPLARRFQGGLRDFFPIIFVDAFSNRFQTDV